MPQPPGAPASSAAFADEFPLTTPRTCRTKVRTSRIMHASCTIKHYARKTFRKRSLTLPDPTAEDGLHPRWQLPPRGPGHGLRFSRTDLQGFAFGIYLGYIMTPTYTPLSTLLYSSSFHFIFHHPYITMTLDSSGNPVKLTLQSTATINSAVAAFCGQHFRPFALACDALA